MWGPSHSACTAFTSSPGHCGLPPGGTGAEHHWPIFGLPVPLSLDNVIAGTGPGLPGLSPLVPAMLFGAITVLMILAGLYLGRIVSRFIRIRPRWDVVVGVALIIEALMLGLRLLPGD